MEFAEHHCGERATRPLGHVVFDEFMPREVIPKGKHSAHEAIVTITRKRLAIPMDGKMAIRSFHNPLFRQALLDQGLSPLYFVPTAYFNAAELDSAHYREFKTNGYYGLLRGRRLMRRLLGIRRYGVRTETTELRFRETLENRVFDGAPIARIGLYAMYMDALRHVPGLPKAAAWLESAVFPTHLHEEALRHDGVWGVLTPGMGSYSFWNEGLFAREAKRIGIPVIATITNYDNLVNKGFRGFMPDCLAVWSETMADDAIRLQSIPANRIEVVGPVQYDRYFRSVAVSRQDFLCSKGLDPAKPTVLYAGGINITRYFDIYKLLVAPHESGGRLPYNLIFRPYPHAKLLSAPQWEVLEALLSRTNDVYISNSLNESSDTLAVADLRRDLDLSLDLDELHCLLKYSDVMINHFSTVSLEAAICDLPAIHVGYDDYWYGHRYSLSSAFLEQQTHNRRKLRLAAAKIARSHDQLLKYVELYLADRTIDQEARQEYALSECGFLDGMASQRLAALIGARART